ncbi:MAG: lipid-A-disaccharide synthase [Nitrospirota bacterium]
MPKKLMISAGEASGELYGALLSREAKELWPDVRIFGIGGERMESEGVDLIARNSSVIGLTDAAKHLGGLWESYKKAKNAMSYERPDILVLIDYPDFNIPLARKAKAAGIPILYYVSPQVWAWRSGRVKKIASLVDKIAVLFPFEVECYRSASVPCEFVGHPITETIEVNKTKEELKQGLGLDPGRPVISLLPGSRPAEIQRHLPIVKEVAAIIHKELPGYQIVLPLAQGTVLNEEVVDYIAVFRNRTREVIACSDASAVASGTATLETALIGTPLVVFYRTSFISYRILKFMVKVKFVCLVNLLSGKMVVRELLQGEADPKKIFSELKRIINDLPYRENMIVNLDNIREMMGGKKPSARVASIVGEIAGWSSTSA